MASETRKITVTGSSSIFRVDGGDATSKTRRRKTNTASQSQSQPQHQAIVKIGGDAIQPTLGGGSGTVPPRGRDTRADGGISGTVREITVVKSREEPSISPVTVSKAVTNGGALDTSVTIGKAVTNGGALDTSVTVSKAVTNGGALDTSVTQPSKVILGGKKPKHMKVVLTKKNHEITPAVASSKPNRKVSLGLRHLKRRVTRARRLNKLSKTAPIEQIKKELVTARIIKTDSKAPEHILRQMYSDTKLLTSKSL